MHPWSAARICDGDRGDVHRVVTALLGVVFSARLVPTISGTLLSVLFVGFLINGFQLTNVSSYWVNGVEGVLIVLVVAATSLVRRTTA